MSKLKYPVINGKKMCSGCSQMLPLSCFKKVHKYYIGKCKKCLAIWAKEYRQKPEVKKITQKYHKAYMKVKENRLRANANMRIYNKTEKYKKRRNLNRREWTLAQKLLAIQYKGGACVVCGYSKCTAALDFHHKNPLEKDGCGTGALKSHRLFEKNKKELDKCILICVRCHREVHAGITEV